MSVISDEALNYYTHHSFSVTFFILDFRLFYSAVIKSLIYNTHIPRRLSLILEDVSLLFSFRFITSLLIINKSITWPNLFPHNFINSHNKLLTNLSSLIHFPLRRYPICCFNGNHTSSYNDSPSVTLRWRLSCNLWKSFHQMMLDDWCAELGQLAGRSWWEGRQRESKRQWTRCVCLSLSSLSGASGRHPQWDSRWKAKFGMSQIKSQVPYHHTWAAALWNGRTRRRESCKSSGEMTSAGSPHSQWQSFFRSRWGWGCWV